MWRYSQSSGKVCVAINGVPIATGYSGHEEGKNNPAMQHVPNVGPLPRGYYTIGAPLDTPSHGPFVLRLTPNNCNQMFGRGGFLIHGDSIPMPGTASHGCIILPRAIRNVIWNSGDHELEVIE